MKSRGETMGYFDGLTSASFKRDESGRTVFYRWGAFGKGHVLPDDETESRIRTFLRRYYMITLPVIIILGALVGWAYVVVAVPILMAWYLLKSKSLVAGCSMSGGKLTFRESYANSAKAHNKKMLWLLLIFSVLFVCAGVLIAIVGASTWDKVVGTSAILFFGACAVVNIYMIRARRT
jgi:hypothetical protein